jgi:hypothetical protein
MYSPAGILRFSGQSFNQATSAGKALKLMELNAGRFIKYIFLAAACNF